MECPKLRDRLVPLRPRIILTRTPLNTLATPTTITATATMTIYEADINATTPIGITTEVRDNPSVNASTLTWLKITSPITMIHAVQAANTSRPWYTTPTIVQTVGIFLLSITCSPSARFCIPYPRPHRLLATEICIVLSRHAFDTYVYKWDYELDGSRTKIINTQRKHRKNDWRKAHTGPNACCGRSANRGRPTLHGRESGTHG